MDPITSVDIGSVTIGGGRPLVLIAGPCVMESRAHTLEMAEWIKRICAELRFPLIFKASFDKANRTSLDSFRGPGLTEGLDILAEVRAKLDMPVLSDIHDASQAEAAGQVLDVIQIPAFLCRQTDLLLAAGQTGKAINVKKGQFMSPEEMSRAVEKMLSVGNRRCLVTERGTFFGYSRLVNDMTAIPVMRRFCPVVFDATHSCQRPGAAGTMSGGHREFVEPLAKAGIAAGADALFLEVHDRPEEAKSDAATVFPLNQLCDLLRCCQAIRAAL